MRNRFEALDIDYTDEEHDMILTTYRGAAKKFLGRSKKLSRPWTGTKKSRRGKRQNWNWRVQDWKD